MVRFYLIFLLAGASLWVGCNEHPITPLERVITAVNRQENTLPAKTKIDFLFVIDDSGSMCEEQANLSRNFSAFSDFLFVELGQSTDYRIAVTSTDILEEQGGNGRFLTGPTRDTIHLQRSHGDRRRESGAGGTLQAAPGHGPIDPHPQSRRRSDPAAIGGTLSPHGNPGHRRHRLRKRSLEAMRLALSCNGPNSSQFGGCCVDDRQDPTGRGKIFNPSCSPSEETGVTEPEFLRPDALLVVIFVTDENDCSDPQSNPLASRRAICKYTLVDQNADGIPDGYNDPQLCPSRDAAACYRVDCGDLPPDRCRTQRCEIETNSNYTANGSAPT